MTNMLSIRLQKIADMIAEGSNVIDIGCDHGFLDIYLTSVKNCTCIASDISENVLKNTRINIKKYNLSSKIAVVCSDGLSNIDVNGYDTIVISGMGTSTILDILDNDKVFDKNLIIQSNNDLEMLRRVMVDRGFYIFDEKVVFDKNKYYVIIYFKNGVKEYNEYDYLFGPIARLNIENYDYYKYLLDKNLEIIKNISKDNDKYKELEDYIYKIKKFTCINM